MTEIKVLSHACLLVKTEKASVIVDPWLVGTCYWRSWSNFPPAQFDEAELRDISAVIISHVHWDHWHGPTLKKYFKNTPIFTIDQPNSRSTDDLRKIGCSSVTELGHNKPINIGDIQICLFQFGLLLQDAAVIIKTDDVSILNANDAKIAGPSLRALTKQHGPFDFALRSHSSANSRICYETVEDPSAENDDRDHYFRSFTLFMDAVNPKFAIPFASNHTHINFDSNNLHKYVSNPIELEKFCSSRQQLWEFRTMLPGSSWSNVNGFNLCGREYFEHYERSIIELRQSATHSIDRYQKIEERVLLTENFAPTLFKFVRRAVPKPLIPDVVFNVTRGGEIAETFCVNSRKVIYLPHNVSHDHVDVHAEKIAINIPNVVLKDAVLKNMFHHAAISKRVRYQARTKADMRHLKIFVFFLELYELSGEKRLKFYFRLLFSYARKAPEILTYLLALFLFVRLRQPMYLIEEKLLKFRS